MDTKREEEGNKPEERNDDWFAQFLAESTMTREEEIEAAHTTIRYLERVRHIERKNADMHYALGNAYLTVGRVDDAIDAFGRVLLLEPHRQDARVSLGAAFIALQNGVEPIEPQADHAKTDSEANREKLARMLTRCFQM